MAVTHVAYEVEDWGVGGWLEGSRVVWHDLPFPRPKTQVTDCHLELVERLRAYFDGAPDSFEDVDVDLEYGRRSSSDAPTPCDRCRAARS